MGMLLSLPLAGVFGSVASSCLAGLAFCFTSTAASMLFKSCNCNSSIATRIGFAIIFILNSMLAWIMKTPAVIGLLQKYSPEYTRMDCDNGSCYGVLAVHRICFALVLVHTILSALLVGVKDTRDKRAAIQNGWWGPKILLWFILIGVSFFIPNGFFIFWGNYASVIGATIFILLGLVLLVDFAHSWSETCTRNWELSENENSMWKWILIGSTFGLYAVVVALTGVMYGFFAGSSCALNRFFISFNLVLCIIITIMCVHPAVQEANPRSGLAQASMVAAYCTYLIMSAVANHGHAGACNPLPGGVSGTKNTTVVLGAVFTFLAIAYSTSRAATQSRALVGRKHSGAIELPTDHDGHSTHGLVTTQPSRTETPRYQALLAAVDAGAIPASALDEELSDDEDDGPQGEERDDERTGTRYNYSWFHVIFIMGSMYVGMLLTDWNVLSAPKNADQDIYIGRSETAMWIRITSSWVCIVIYGWSLIAPVILPDRFGDY